MSFAKKMKRNKEAAIRKTVTKVAGSAITARKQGESIIRNRKYDMFCFYRVKILTAASYIMNTQFGWTIAKLKEICARFKYLMDLIVDGPKEGHVYLKCEWLVDGLEEECRYKMESPKKPAIPDDVTSVEDWVRYYHQGYGEVLCNRYETIWLWALHEIFGFSRKRLERFHGYFTRFDPVNAPVKMIYNAMDCLEQLRTRRRIDGECGRVSMEDFRKQLAALDVDRNCFASGLNLMLPAGRTAK